MNLKFKNGKFTVLQVSDAQDLQHVRKAMSKMLNIAYDRVKPDLVVLTGDNVLGNHFRDENFWTPLFVKDKESEYKALKTSIKKLVLPIEKRKIPFCMIYGNHDDMNEITKDEHAAVYREYSYFTGLNDDKTVDCDTYNLPIYSSDGNEIKYNLWFMDSAWKNKEEDRCYQMVKPEAIEWYKNKSLELKNNNGGKAVPSIMFQHIPLIETLNLVKECDKTEKGAVLNPEDKKYYKLKESAVGVMEEFPSAVSKSNGQFEAMKDCGDVKAIVFGHDHPNCFTGSVEGIDFVQTSCASFRCYGGRSRGVRVFTIDEKNLAYETEFLTYEDLCGNSLKSELRYIWDADDMIKEKIKLCLGYGFISVVLKRLKNKDLSKYY